MKELDQRWISEKGWEAFFLDDADLTKFVATALIRYCKSIGLKELFAMDTVDLFRSVGGKLNLRKVLISLDGISQA